MNETGTRRAVPEAAPLLRPRGIIGCQHPMSGAFTILQPDSAKLQIFAQR